jgi:hypothetical protein
VKRKEELNNSSIWKKGENEEKRKTRNEDQFNFSNMKAREGEGESMENDGRKNL